jgi:alkylhydroperoxidase family enzyme
MHTGDARKDGETERRLAAVAVWRESPFFTPRERAALAWTEAVTRIADTRVPDDAYDEARAHYTEQELIELTLLVNTINCWNRFAVAFRAQPE